MGFVDVQLKSGWLYIATWLYDVCYSLVSCRYNSVLSIIVGTWLLSIAHILLGFINLLMFFLKSFLGISDIGGVLSWVWVFEKYCNMEHGTWNMEHGF